MTLFDTDPSAVSGGGAGVGVETAESADRGPTAALATIRLRLVVAYDGAGYRGFAAQHGQRTVAGELAAAIATVARHPVELTCAGRTDAGVHAEAQVVHVDVHGDIDLVRLVKAVNTMIGPTVVVRSAELAPAGFDARRSALARAYRYLVLESDMPDPLLAPLSWHVRGPLDVRAMAGGADALLGEHDFRAFCRRAPGTSADDPIVRRVMDARFVEVRSPFGPIANGRLLAFDISATSFCHQMVRSVMGVLVDVGRGRHRASDVNWLLSSGRRSSGTTIAPPHGLCLTAVTYPE